jgi:Flp pilus assembly protein TadB
MGLLFFLLFFIGILGFMGIMLFAYAVFVATRATTAAARWVVRQQEQERQLAAQAQVPETSLLRAGNAPASSPDMLVRPTNETPGTDPQHLLRIAEE